MGTEQDLRKGIEEALVGLEQLADETRIKLHLGTLDVARTWAETVAPRLFEAREHAKEATAASKAAIEQTAKVIREFAESI